MTLIEPEEILENMDDDKRHWYDVDFGRTDRMKQKRGKGFLDYVGPVIVAGVFFAFGYLIYWGATDFVPSLREGATNPTYEITAPVDSLEAAAADTSYIPR